MAATAASGLQMAAVRPCISTSRQVVKTGAAVYGGDSQKASWAKLASASHISTVQPLLRSLTTTSKKLDKVVTKAMAESSDGKPASGLPIDLRGRYSFFIFMLLVTLLFQCCYLYLDLVHTDVSPAQYWSKLVMVSIENMKILHWFYLLSMCSRNY